jgi:hypothetical protein
MSLPTDAKQSVGSAAAGQADRALPFESRHVFNYALVGIIGVLGGIVIGCVFAARGQDASASSAPATHVEQPRR